MGKNLGLESSDTTPSADLWRPPELNEFWWVVIWGRDIVVGVCSDPRPENHGRGSSVITFRTQPYVHKKARDAGTTPTDGLLQPILVVALTPVPACGTRPQA